MAVLLPYQPGHKSHNLELWNIAQDISSELEREVDLVDLREALTVFRFHIIRDGKLLYTSDKNETERFADVVFSMYVDFVASRGDLGSLVSGLGEKAAGLVADLKKKAASRERQKER